MGEGGGLRCRQVPQQVRDAVGLNAATLGFMPHRNQPGYVLTGTSHSWEGWVWQEKENGPCTWYLFVNGSYYILWQEHSRHSNGITAIDGDTCYHGICSLLFLYGLIILAATTRTMTMIMTKLCWPLLLMSHLPLPPSHRIA